MPWIDQRRELRDLSDADLEAVAITDIRADGSTCDQAERGSSGRAVVAPCSGAEHFAACCGYCHPAHFTITGARAAALTDTSEHSICQPDHHSIVTTRDHAIARTSSGIVCIAHPSG